MKDLIEALQILLKYANDDRNPTGCEHDMLYVCCGIELEKVSFEDVEKLEELGFFWNEETDTFASYRYGSC